MTDQQKKYVLDNRGLKSQRQIANELGVNESCVSMFIKIHKRGISPKKQRIQELVAYIKENADNKTLPEMSAETGASTMTLNGLCIRNNITPITIREKTFYLLSHSKGKSIPELCKITGLEETAVRKYMRDFGMPYPDIKNNIKPLPKFTSEEKEFISRWLNRIEREENSLTSVPFRSNRLKDKYNQTGSSLTDELNGIETTKRDKTLYE